MHSSCIFNLGNHWLCRKGWGDLLHLPSSQSVSPPAHGVQTAFIALIKRKLIPSVSLFGGQINVLRICPPMLRMYSAIISKCSRCFLYFLGGQLEREDKYFTI